MNPLLSTNELNRAAGLFTNYSASLSFQLMKEIQLEKEKNRVLVQELEKQKTKSKEYESEIFSLLSKSNHLKNTFHGFPFASYFKKSVDCKKKIKGKHMTKHKKQKKN